MYRLIENTSMIIPAIEKPYFLSFFKRYHIHFENENPLANMAIGLDSDRIKATNPITAHKNPLCRFVFFANCFLYFFANISFFLSALTVDSDCTVPL